MLIFWFRNVFHHVFNGNRLYITETSERPLCNSRPAYLQAEPMNPLLLTDQSISLCVSNFPLFCSLHLVYRLYTVPAHYQKNHFIANFLFRFFHITYHQTSSQIFAVTYSFSAFICCFLFLLSIPINVSFFL